MTKERLTLWLDAGIVAEARAMAAKRQISLSAFLREQLLHIVYERRAFRNAKRRALKRLRTGLDLRWSPQRSRDDLHQR